VPETTVKNFYAVGFDALVKRWDKCINVGGRYVAKIYVSSWFKYRMFNILYPFVPYLLNLPRSSSLSSLNGLPYTCPVLSTCCEKYAHKNKRLNQTYVAYTVFAVAFS
jgi:hypothetical protein